MVMQLDSSEYQARVINSFAYLDPQDSDEPGCFVLIDADIDSDGQADLRCAVDLEGDIISLLFVSDLWDSVKIEAPIGDAAQSLDAVAKEEGAGEAAAEPDDEGEAANGPGEAN
jgi:hypothetical protein